MAASPLWEAILSCLMGKILPGSADGSPGAAVSGGVRFEKAVAEFYEVEGVS